jgi:hypothetical protein
MELNEIKQLQLDTNTDYKNTLIAYEESKYDTKNRKSLLVNIGLLCNSIETKLSFDMVKYWDIPLTKEECFDNANKYVNNQKWKEEEQIRNPIGSGIQILSGLSRRSSHFKYFFEKNVNYFIEQQIPENQTDLINDFSQLNIPEETVVEYFGYFCPNVSGIYTFCVSRNEGMKICLWINSDNALYDYTFDNADISSKTANKTQTYLFQNELYAFRIQILNSTQQPLTENLFWVETNNGNIIKNTEEHNFFITLTKNNQLYKKQLLYFGIVENKENTKLYDCFFINPTANNYNVIQSMKMHPKILYNYVVIPTKITFSGNGNSTKPEGTSTNINIPIGIDLNVNQAQYGVSGNHNINVFEKQTTTQNVFKPATSYITPNLPNTEINIQGHYEPTTQTKTVAVSKSVPSSFDVLNKVKPLVISNSLSIDGNYNNHFGDPYYGHSKNLNVNYSYSQNLSNITNKNLYISSTGQVLIGYTFNDIEYSIPLEMDTTYSPQINSKIQLSDYGILEVLDVNNKIIGKKNLFQYIKNTSITDCLPNPIWIENPHYSKQIKVGEKMPSTVHNLVSSNGLFSIGFHKGDLVLHFCKNPEKKKGDFYYTDTTNLDNNGNQIYYFYRSLIRGIDGKKFLVQKSAPDFGLAYYVPNSLKNILSVKDYTQIDGAIPLELNNYTKITTPDENNCKTKCLDNCNHYFYQTTDKLCYLDNTNNSNPLYSNSNSKSKLKQKQYKINSTCRDNHSNQILYKTQDDFKTIGIQYTSVDDDPSKTYNCGLPQTQIYNTKYHSLITKVVEGFSNTMNGELQDLQTQQTQFTNLQNQINNKYQITTNLLNQHNNLSVDLQNQPFSFFNSENIIPDIYKKIATQINTSTSLNDARIQDLNITLLEQNNLYTISAISMATVLLITIFLAKD